MNDLHTIFQANENARVQAQAFGRRLITKDEAQLFLSALLIRSVDNGGAWTPDDEQEQAGLLEIIKARDVTVEKGDTPPWPAFALKLSRVSPDGSKFTAVEHLTRAEAHAVVAALTEALRV